MPIYEYRCSSCGMVFEVEQRITEPPLRIHEGCGGEVTRLISNTSFILKGTGWYKTDYASGRKGKEEGKEKGDAGGEKGSSDGSASCGDNCACAVS